jgi:hypothetical protein
MQQYWKSASTHSYPVISLTFFRVKGLLALIDEEVFRVRFLSQFGLF